MSNNKEINKFKVHKNGLLGATITYSQPEEVKDKIYSPEYSKKHDAPVPMKIIREMEAFRIHLMRMYENWAISLDKYYDFANAELKSEEDGGADAEKRSQLISKIDRCAITELVFKEDSFMILGTYRKANSDVHVKMNSELVRDGEYEYYDEIMDRLRNLVPMISDYADNTLVSDRTEVQFQVFKDAYTGDDDAIKVFDSLNDDLKEELASKYLESKGRMTIDPSLLIHPDGHPDEEEEEMPQEEEEPQTEQQEEAQEEESIENIDETGLDEQQEEEAEVVEAEETPIKAKADDFDVNEDDF